MAASTLKGLIRGDVPLSRAIFGDERQRRLIPQLQEEGWPIFDVAGKRCGFAADLAAHVRKAIRAQRQRRARSQRRGKAERGTRAMAEALRCRAPPS